MASGAAEPLAAGVADSVAAGAVDSIAAGVVASPVGVASGAGLQAFKVAAIATPAIMPKTLSFMCQGSKIVRFVEKNACAGTPGMIMTPMA
jgi:hypothetical protein